MVKTYHIADYKLLKCSPQDASIFIYISPTEDERKHLVNEYKIDEHTLNSALDPDELSRLEFEPEHAAMIYKKPRNYSSDDQFLFKVTSMGLFLFKEKVFIVASEDLPIFEGKYFNKINSLPDLILKLMNRAIYHYFEHLKLINMISEALENKINASMENKYLLNLFTLEKSLVYYLNSINSNSMLIEKLKANASKIGFSQEEQEFLEDIIIENNQCYKQAEIYSNILAGLMDARASIVSNNLNVLMKTLNLITIMIMVPTFVVSLFSMNVKIPLSANPVAFWIIFSIAFFSVFFTVIIWKIKEKSK